MILSLLIAMGLQSAAGTAAAPAKADDVARGVQLLQKAQKAMGGADKLAAVKDTTQTSEITLDRTFGGYTIKQTVSYLAPSSIRQQQESRHGRMVVYADGITGRMITWKNNISLSKDAVNTASALVFRMPCPLIMSDRDSSRKVRAVGANAVEITPAKGDKVKIDFDPATGLPMSLSYSVIANDKPATRVDTLSDWRDVKGLRLPFQLAQADDGKKVLQQVVSEYKVNSGLTSADMSRQ